MVELMIVIGLIVLLMGLIVVRMANVREKGKVANTDSKIRQVQIKLEEYKKLTGVYPPDGFESTVETEQGTQLFSGAALAYALAMPVPQFNITPSGERVPVGSQPPIFEFLQSDLYRDEGDPEAVELVDAWDQPMHYDDLTRGREAYNIQESADVHLMQGIADHGPDPREVEGVVMSFGPQSPGQFDIWSHGTDGHRREYRIENTIGTWARPVQGKP